MCALRRIISAQAREGNEDGQSRRARGRVGRERGREGEQEGDRGEQARNVSYQHFHVLASEVDGYRSAQLGGGAGHEDLLAVLGQLVQQDGSREGVAVCHADLEVGVVLNEHGPTTVQRLVLIDSRQVGRQAGRRASSIPNVSDDGRRGTDDSKEACSLC